MNQLQSDKLKIQKRIIKLLHFLKKADKAYHNSDKPIASDEVYDSKRDRLELLVKQLHHTDPNNKVLLQANKYLTKIGASVEGKLSKVKIPFFAYSLSKIKNDDPDRLKDWVSFLKKNGKELLCSPKIDGCSLFLLYKNGLLEKAFTRGDGVVGSNVSVHAKLLSKVKIIPVNLPIDKTVIVRGELAIKNSVFEKRWKNKKISSVLKEPRNAVNGFINGYKQINSKLSKKFAKDLTFIAYEILDKKGLDFVLDKSSKEELLVLLEKYRFTTYLGMYGYKKYNPFTSKKSSTFKDFKFGLDKLLSKARKSNEFNCDGLVLEINNAKYRKVLKENIQEGDKPKHIVSYKVGMLHADQQISLTPVVKVEWNTSKSAALKPLVYYKTVMFGNTKNTKANGVNAANIQKLGIGKGTIVKVVRSGDIIPQIIGSKQDTRKKNVLPSRCECGAKTIMVGKDLFCSKPADCKFFALKQLIASVRNLKIDGLRKGKLEKLYNAGYISLYSLLKANSKKISKIDGFGEKTALQIHNNLHKAIKKASLSDLMVVSGKFIQPGFSLAHSRAAKIEKYYGNKLLAKLSRKKVFRKLSSTSGLGEVAAKCFVTNHKSFVRWYKKIKQYR